MHMTRAFAALLVLCLDLCAPIRVPIAWQNGEVTKESKEQLAVVNVENINPQNERKPIPVEYFEYTAKKPQFAVDIAAAHGVQAPEQLYKAYPIRPHTNQAKPHLGVHHILDKDKTVYQPLQKFIKKQQLAVPVSSNYEVFHPYKAEEPALQQIYRDPVLAKIRTDLESNKNRLQNYEKQAGESDITKDEYTESPKQTDQKLFPQKNHPTEFEIHKPQRRPVYYRISQKHNNRDHVINKKLKHPWNQNYVKIKPVHYYPLQNHIQNLRQNQAVKYDDEHNEYPQVTESEKLSEPSEGYDIYEKGKQNYERLRNNVDESINKAVQQNRPVVYKKLEIQNNDQSDENDDDEEEDEFVPIKNYAQVRKTESIKHLPREAALEDAETYEEIRNAPRLREAVKSTKAQTVYTEEGYEDTAYDHAGEQKHASDHELHGGFLKQKEISEGKFKIPSIAASHDDNDGSEYKDKVIHGKKWKNDDKDYEKSVDKENYEEEEQEQSAEIDTYKNNSEESRNKRENYDESVDANQSDLQNDTLIEHDVNKREVDIEIPEINLNSTYLSEKEILEIAKLKLENKEDEIKEKYPYYDQQIKSVNKHSPLRYAENLKLIPKKSKGGTEFYDSRSKLQCPEVEDVDPLPEKIKNGENPNDNDNDDSDENDTKKEKEKGETGFEIGKKQPRLRNLGDKIDCFKAKYFGENPLDSPFFKEDLILNPEPVTIPNLPTYKLNNLKIQPSQEAQASDIVEKINAIHNEGRTDVFVLLDKLRGDQNKLSDSLDIKHDKLQKLVTDNHNSITPRTVTSQGTSIYNDILNNIKKQQEELLEDIDEDDEDEYYSEDVNEPKQNQSISNQAYVSYQNKEDVTQATPKVRKKRSTAFIYEPYKIIRESQVQDSKKTTTSSNISPLIKQMQSNRVVDRVTRANQEPGKRRNKKEYKDIGRSDREKTTDKGEEITSEPSFVDVNVDQRRGEPRYEIKHPNHKSEYKPVENMKNISLEDYRAQTEPDKFTTEGNVAKVVVSTTKRMSRQRRPTPKPVFDVSEFLPNRPEKQSVAASNTVRRTVTTTAPLIAKSTIPTTTTSQETAEEDESGEEYEEYDEDEESEEKLLSTTTTTTTTKKPVFKRRRIATTTEATNIKHSTETTEPKLRLTTRFRNSDQHKTVHNYDKEVEKQKRTELPHNDDSLERVAPKYREKKKKSSKSTLVTDTKQYGDDVDDIKEKEVDALIGIKHDMKDYMPEYEKKFDQKYKDMSREEEEFEDSLENFDDIDEDSSSEEEDDEEDEEIETKPTTPEPTKRTLIQTTDAPIPTVAARSARIEEKPIVSRKKIEIHKELPVDKTLPHTSQFKQDIKEVEIIKEVTPAPKKHPRKHKEALDLYKDDKLAKEINNLGDVEVFKENLDLEHGPRHGGNYRSIEDATEVERQGNLQLKPKDTEASQSENTRHNIELDEYTPRRMHGGNLKSFSDISKSRNSNHNSKLTELSDSANSRSAMHGGNLRYDLHNNRGRNKFERLVELDDNDHREHSSKDDNYRNVGNTRRGQAMHGGNYRSAKIVQTTTTTTKPEENEYDIRARPDKSPNARRNSAVLLNSFAQAIPILTTTPAYILDPSKRMYYYVEA